MPIEVRHDGPIGDVALLQAQAAAAQAAEQQRLRDLQEQQFNDQLLERQRQFNVQMGMNLRGQDIAQQARRENMAWQDAQNNARFQQQAALQGSQQQAALYGDVLNQQQALELQDNQAGLQWQQQSAQSAESVASEVMKQAREMKLDDEGVRHRNKLAGELRGIVAGRARLEPDAYDAVMAQWMEKYEAADLGSFEIKEPTPEENLQRQILTMDGQPVPADGSFSGWGLLRQPPRNGGEPTYKPHFFMPANPIATIDGVRGRYKPSGEFIPLEDKAAEQAAAAAEKAAEKAKAERAAQEAERDAAIERMRKRHDAAVNDANPDETVPDFDPTADDVIKEMEKERKLNAEIERRLGGGPAPASGEFATGSGTQESPFMFSPDATEEQQRQAWEAAPQGAFFTDDQGNIWQKP